MPSAMEEEAVNYGKLARGERSKGDELEDIRFRGVRYYVRRWVLLDCLVFTGELRRFSNCFKRGAMME